MSLFTTQGLFISNTHKSASSPFPRLPLFIPRIFAGFEVIEAINDGTIDVIVSDHKPEDEESKRLTFSQATTGATGVETLLPLALELFHNKSVKLMNLIASITSNPAKILGINKGSLEKGNEADLCVFDINKPWVVNKDKLKSKSKNTPIEDRKLQGQVLKTFVNGEMAFERV